VNALPEPTGNRRDDGGVHSGPEEGAEAEASESVQQRGDEPQQEGRNSERGAAGADRVSRRGLAGRVEADAHRARKDEQERVRRRD